MKIDYKAITSIKYVSSCVGITASMWNTLMEGHVRGNKREINKLVKLHYPGLYRSLALNAYNPYNYHRTSKHLILVHSSIEYFFSFKT